MIADRYDSRYFNEEGEPLMTHQQMLTEQALDELSAYEAQLDQQYDDKAEITMKISHDIADTLESEFGDEFRPSYSGRFMYGKTCVGVVTDSAYGPANFVRKLAEAIAEERSDDDPGEDDVEEIIAEIGEPTSDSMGRSTIFYWPNVSVDQ